MESECSGKGLSVSVTSATSKIPSLGVLLVGFTLKEKRCLEKRVKMQTDWRTNS